MKLKKLLMEQITREKEYLDKHEVGTEEYCKSMDRLNVLEDKLEKLNSESAKNLIEYVKIGTGVAVPIIGLVCITATEKDSTFTGALKDYTKLFIPKKWF